MGEGDCFDCIHKNVCYLKVQFGVPDSKAIIFCKEYLHRDKESVEI